jgi:hypothetical protein
MKSGLYSSASWQEPMAGFHEYGDEPSHYITFLSSFPFSFFYLFFLFLGTLWFCVLFYDSQHLDYIP